MVRAAVALLGFAAAAAILYLVPDAGNVVTDPIWGVPLLWAAAGLVAGVAYQIGGLRRPGVKVNRGMLLVVFAPWAAVTLALIASLTDDPPWLARLASDLAGSDAVRRWESSLGIFAFVSGLLLALSVVEPRVARKVVTAPATTPAIEPADPRSETPGRVGATSTT